MSLSLISLLWKVFVALAPFVALILSWRLWRRKEETERRLDAMERELWQLRKDRVGAKGIRSAEVELPPAAPIPAVPPSPSILPAPRAASAAPPPLPAETSSPEAPANAIPPPLPPLPKFEPSPAWPPKRAAEVHADVVGTGSVPPPLPEESPALNFEARFGVNWLPKIALVILAIGFGLAAKMLQPMLGPAARVGILYGLAVGLFGIGSYFESRLKAFSRPVMAGGLALGFFVSYAAHFVRPMECLPATVSIVWMLAGVGSVLFFADRWKSQSTAGLAIFLGHVAAFVSARDADSFSLVVVAFLSLAAVAMFLRNDWPPLSLFAAVAAYGSHVLWSLLEVNRDEATLRFWTHFIFLSSYYSIFMAADLLWWGRQSREAEEKETPWPPPGLSLAARAVAPVNLVCYVSLVSLLYVGQRNQLKDIDWFFFGLGFAQGALGLAHRRLKNPDWELYPALGVIFLTLGFMTAWGGLTLNLVLAAEALILLLAAHRTRLWVFHGLAQGALLLNFVHYWIFQEGRGTETDLTTTSLIGGLMVASVYFVKSQLEEIWCGGGSQVEWKGAGERGPIGKAVFEFFNFFYAPIAPWLAHLHAVGGALLLAHQINLHFTIVESSRVVEVDGTALNLAACVGGMTVLALVRRSIPLALGYLTLQFSLLSYASLGLSVSQSPHNLWIECAVLAAGWLSVAGWIEGAHRRWREPEKIGTAWGIAQAALWLGLLSATLFIFNRPVRADTKGIPGYLAWIATLGLVAFCHERLAAAYRRGIEQSANARTSLTFASGASCLALALLIIASTGAVMRDVRIPLWLSCWTIAMLAAGAWRKNLEIYLSGLLILCACHARSYFHDPPGDADALVPTAMIWIIALSLGVAAAQDWALRRYGSPLSATRLIWAQAATYLPYALGLLLLQTYVEDLTPFPWSVPVIAAGAVGLYGISCAGRLQLAGVSSCVFLFWTQMRYLVLEKMPIAYRLEHDPLLPILCLLAVTILFERLLARDIGREKPWKDMDLPDVARLALIAAGAVCALHAMYESPALGRHHEWTTAGWSGIGLLLAGLGFAFRSAGYRRTGLAALALCLGRVLLVDTLRLEGIYKPLAFIILSGCLLGVAWLYSRFAEEIRKLL